jgi:hypothetical protein
MKLRFNYDERGGRFTARIRLKRQFAGPPGHAHGGIIATILDEAMSKLNKPNGITAVTSEMTVNYLRPVPLNQCLLKLRTSVATRWLAARACSSPWTRKKCSRNCGEFGESDACRDNLRGRVVWLLQYHGYGRGLHSFAAARLKMA